MRVPADPVEIVPAAEEFSDWIELLQLLHDAFAYMTDRIDPPSSLTQLTPELVAVKAQQETLFLAKYDYELIGCVFARQQSDSVYVGKLAVRQDHRGAGIGRRLMQAAEQHAHAIGIPEAVLDTRIELTENHETFESMGYSKTGEHAHEGYNRPTYISMHKLLSS